MGARRMKQSVSKVMPVVGYGVRVLVQGGVLTRATLKYVLWDTTGRKPFEILSQLVTQALGDKVETVSQDKKNCRVTLNGITISLVKMPPVEEFVAELGETIRTGVLTSSR